MLVDFSPKIIIDTREKTPLPLTIDIRPEVATLKTGDYSVKGAEDWFCIERKSLEDLTSTLSLSYEVGYNTSDKRFNKELARMAEMIRNGGFAQVWITDRIESLWARRYHCTRTPANLFGIMQSASVRYGVPFIWMGSPKRAATELTNLARHVTHRIERLAQAARGDTAKW